MAAVKENELGAIWQLWVGIAIAALNNLLNVDRLQLAQLHQQAIRNYCGPEKVIFRVLHDTVRNNINQFGVEFENR